jgi:AraC-like DNA-binding protein
MKPIFQRLTTEPDEGFVFKALRGAGFDCPWHSHAEYELILVLSGSGYRIVGDNITPLGLGDLVFVGPGLPHIWQEEQGPGAPLVHALLIQFREGCLGQALLALPALEPVRRLFTRAGRGLEVSGATRKKVTTLMMAMTRTAGLERIVQFLQVLDLLANSSDCHPIASPDFSANPQSYDQARMDRVFQFLTNRLAVELRLAEAARLVHLSEGAFSRFFRLHTGKTFPRFVNELRVGRACRLLTESEKNVTQVALECGFTNLSNFNRQFLRLKGLSPRTFRRQILERLPGTLARVSD